MNKLLLTATLLAATLLASNAGADYRTETVANGVKIPWAMAWLPDGDLLVTERRGELLRFRNGELVTKLTGVPEVHSNAQGGLLDLALHPDFADNQLIYMSFSDKSGEGAGSNTAIAKATLDGDSLKDLQVIYKATPNTRSAYHYGSRMTFDNDGYLFFSIGDRGKRDVNPQDPSRDAGKVYRLHDDGRVPADNPFVNTDNAVTSAYSLGHRNIQGMALHPETGEIWTHEHGPRGGDEVNVIRAGENYGWPILSYGINYSGTSFAEGTEREGYVSPNWHWVPSIAPSGMAFVTSERYPDWQGHLLIGALKSQSLVLTRLDGNRVISAETVIEDLGRVRDVRQAPDGYIYVAIDGVGVKRIVPDS